MANSGTVAVIGARRYAEPVVRVATVDVISAPAASAALVGTERTASFLPRAAIAAVAAALVTTASVSWNGGEAQVAQNNSVIGASEARLLRPLVDASGVAFDDGNGGAFHIF